MSHSLQRVPLFAVLMFCCFVCGCCFGLREAQLSISVGALSLSTLLSLI